MIRFIPATAEPAVPLGDNDLPTLNDNACPPDITPNKKYNAIKILKSISVYKRMIDIIVNDNIHIVRMSLYRVVKVLIIDPIPNPMAVPMNKKLFMYDADDSLSRYLD